MIGESGEDEPGAWADMIMKE